MNAHFNQNRQQGNRQEFMQQMRQTEQHNFMTTGQTNMYQSNPQMQGGYQRPVYQQPGYQQPVYQQPQPVYQQPMQQSTINPNSHQRPPVNSDGGCCCSVM